MSNSYHPQWSVRPPYKRESSIHLHPGHIDLPPSHTILVVDALASTSQRLSRDSCCYLNERTVLCASGDIVDVRGIGPVAPRCAPRPRAAFGVLAQNAQI